MRMRAWRLRRTGGAGLGLFAMLLQLVLSFGHVHARVPILPQAPGNVQTIAAQAASIPAQHEHPGGLPASDDDCPICATMQLAGSGVIPVAPLASCPTQFVEAVHQPLVGSFVPRITRHALFQTRAPPMV
jgi:hypothetical protein